MSAGEGSERSEADTSDPRSASPAVPAAWWLVTLVIIGGTLAWAVRFALGYLFTPASCQVGAWLQALIAITALLVGAAALLANVVLLRRGPDPAVRFTLLVGVGLNVFFLGAILMESSAIVFVDACAKGAIP